MQNKRLITISTGFVTNSSTMVTVIYTEPDKILDKLSVNLKDINAIIEQYFDKFVEKDMNIECRDYYSDFIAKVKKYIPIVIDELKSFARENKDSEKVILKSKSNINGCAIDTDNPKTYALWFVLKYILKDIGKFDECYC